jgi:hypothetical protein
MQKRIVAGPYHPAFRELAEGEALLEKSITALNFMQKGPVMLFVAKGSYSKMAGHNRRNLKILQDLGFSVKIHEDEALGYLEVIVKKGR